MKKVILQIVLIIILKRSELTHIILYLSVVNKNKNEYYYNIFLGKGSYKSDTRYF